jgi:N-acetylglucosamine-6-sulfatase
VSDKPAYIRNKPLLTAGQMSGIDAGRRNQLRTLLAVDEAVQRILTALSDTGRLGTTFILFSSDNGLLRGEHRYAKKVVPYEESIHVPLVIRYDPLPAASGVNHRMVLNVDWAPTAADVAGVPSPGVEGTSMLPLLADLPHPRWRTEFPLEHMKGGASDIVPSYCGVRTGSYKYVAYNTKEEELYDLVNDPYELQNLAKQAAYATLKADLRAQAQALCKPVPPGFSW